MKSISALPLLQNLYTAVIWVDSDFKIEWVNLQAEQLFSVSKSRLIGLTVFDILTPCDTETSLSKTDTPHSSAVSMLTEAQDNTHQLEMQFNHAKEFQQPFIKYSRYIKGVNHPVYAHYSVTPVEQKAEILFLIEIWEGDRHSRLDREHRLQEQHDVSREMLRSVAHEVKNPLAGIRGAAQLLIKQTQKHTTGQNTTNSTDTTTVLVDAKRLTTYANIVISETDRLTALIEQLLGSNKPPKLQTINIHQPLEHVLLLTQSQHPSITIQRDYDLSLPELIADNNQLIQVLLNLVNNACEAMLEQDKVLLTPDYRPKLTIITRVEHQYTIGKIYHRQVIKVSIRDNGPGIAPDLIERIFFPLVTSRASGTGLGLALVQDIIHQHQGAVEVNSQPGRTQFDVYLPFAPEFITQPQDQETATKFAQ